MAKISFTKLGLAKTREPVKLQWGENEIEVAQYLPAEKKIDIISTIINSTVDENNYFNECRFSIIAALELVYAYTNINFTEKQKEDFLTTYDKLKASGLYDKVLYNIPLSETNEIVPVAHSIIESIYKYKNSALGILENISSDYSNLDFDAEELQKKMADPNAIATLKEVLEKMG